MVTKKHATEEVDETVSEKEDPEVDTTEEQEDGDKQDAGTEGEAEVVHGLHLGPEFYPETKAKALPEDKAIHPDTTPSYNPADPEHRKAHVAKGPEVSDLDVHDYRTTKKNDGHPGYLEPQY